MSAGPVSLATTRIESVIPAGIDSEGLTECRIDSPRPNEETGHQFIDITGQVLRRSASAVAIEIAHHGQVCCRVPVSDGGFTSRIPLPGFGRLQLDLRAVFRDHSQAPLATVRVARQWTAGVHPPACELVSVVITCFNQARFLNEAIDSVLAQTYPNFELSVIDDGSGDNTAEVTTRYPGVHYVRQGNAGLAAARNRGVAESRGAYLVFLDSDDRLMPGALEAGLRHLAQHPDSGFVAGRHRMIDFNGALLWEHTVGPEDDDLYCALLRRNFIAMHAAVMYQRFVFETVGAFDPRPRSTEDYDLYLRIARRYSVGWHPTVVAEYRRHSANMTDNVAVVLKSALRALRSQRAHAMQHEKTASAYRAGRRFFRHYYGGELVTRAKAALAARNWRMAAAAVFPLFLHHPRGLWSILSGRNERSSGSPDYQAPGGAGRSISEESHVDFGGLRRLKPISDHSGYDRGLPVDRYYVEAFLGLHAEDIRGRVLEFGDSEYTRRFGGALVKAVDVVNVDGDHVLTTIVADLSHAEHIPSDTFDCIVATQTLQYVDDLESAAGALHRILRPGGVLLLTVPGTVSRISPDLWRNRWNWGFTPSSLQRLIMQAWRGGSVDVHAHGNVLVSLAVLHGLATHEFTRAELDEVDSSYPVLLTARAVKRPAPRGSREAARGRTACGPVVLLYHRIARTAPDPWGLSVTPDHFAEHLEVLCRDARPVRLGDVIHRGDVDARSVAVTFDDGYADNVLQARPLLEARDVPATVFLATGYVGEREFWWDELARHVFEPGRVPCQLSMAFGGRIYEWKLHPGAASNEGGPWPEWRAWHDDPTSRHYLYRSLWELMRTLTEIDRGRALEELGRWTGATRPPPTDLRPLTRSELVSLAGCELFELGSHTRTHPLLSALDPAAQREQIEGSKRDLKEVTGVDPKSFAYPYGQPSAYSDATIALVRDAGFDVACTNSPRAVGPGADRLQLPRFHVENWDGEEFARRLSEWFQAT